MVPGGGTTGGTTGGTDAARVLGVPAVLTEEDPGRKGPTAAGILAAVGPDAPVFTKPVFGLAAGPDIMAALVAPLAFQDARPRAQRAARVLDRSWAGGRRRARPALDPQVLSLAMYRSWGPAA